MIKKVIQLLLIFTPVMVFSQSVWKKANESEINLRSTDIREVIPTKYQTFSFDAKAFDAIVSQAPSEFSKEGSRNQTTIDLPLPDGQLATFMVWQSPVMEKELAEKYPQIKSYKGYQLGNKGVVARFGIGPNGFHAVIKSDEGTVYVDPYSLRNQHHYMSYYTSDHIDNSLYDRVLCGTKDEVAHDKKGPKWGTETRNRADKMELRLYRLALACTGEWGTVRGTKENALAEMVTFIDRANVIFETELALRLVLIAKNDELIFLDPDTDPYTSADEGLVILGQNGSVLNAKVGENAYEVGHVFSRCFDVGGVAGGNICTPGKGAGVTCHNGNSVTNGVVLIFNHEVGHQMTASHTFNRCGDTDQLALGTAYEPGSGNTILSYAGACGSDNLGVPREAYYHVASLDQMLSFTNSPGSDAYSCAEKVDINNFVPVIDMPYENGFFIPKSTPFFLTASATDENNDPMTYTWEQFDNLPSVPLGSPVGNCPLFRSYKDQSNPTRFFPNTQDLLAGRFTQPTELLPTYGRDLTFRFVVRDNNPMGNASVWEELAFKVAPNAGPFRLTSPFNNFRAKIGDAVKVTWDVNNTDIAPVNCKEVDIYISYNGSFDFKGSNMILVSKSTPNDGEEDIIMPNRTTVNARIVIKASDNVFLTTSIFNSIIETPETPSIFVDVTESVKSTCLPENVSYTFSTLGLGGLTDNIKFEVLSGLPTGAVATFTKDAVLAGETNTLNLDLSGAIGTNEYKIVVRAFAPGFDTLDRIIQLKTTGTDLSNIELQSPPNGINGLGPTQIYQWETKVDATEYTLEVATSPDFSPSNIVISRTQTGTSFPSNTFLDKATIYYWRVRSNNVCKDGDWSEINAFNTEALSCALIKSGTVSVNIPGNGLPVIEYPIEVTAEGIVSDVNLKNIMGTHQRVGDLVTYLVAPSGKEALVWSRKCSTISSFNVGADDQSNNFFQCPINAGNIYRPESPFSVFNGESIKGQWKFRIEDKVAGSGGKLTNLDLELCANIILNPPVLSRNEVLEIHPKDNRNIDRTLLLSEDQNNSAAELKFTLVKSPTKGTLTINGAPLAAGSIFTQQNIDDFNLVYIHTADDEDDDSFSFTVSDGQGGWVTITDFIIDVDSSFPSATSDITQANNILVYPNPTNESLNVKFLDSNHGFNTYQILDITGRVMMSSMINNDITTVDVQQLQSGIYLVKLTDGKKSIHKKFVRQ
jgi:subtilisin-like proprotein convertase family protein